jgi:hypothetical protein
MYLRLPVKIVALELSTLSSESKILALLAIKNPPNYGLLAVKYG